MRVLLATDGSKDGSAAAEWLRRFPLPPDTTVSILTVAELAQPPVEFLPLPELRDSVLALSRHVADQARKHLRSRWPNSDVQVVEGDPREEIPRVAEEWGADLVIVGARGLGAVKSFLLGSVSLSVVRYAPCPVLVVKGQPRELHRVLLAMDGSEAAFEALRFLASLELETTLTAQILGVVEELPLPRSAPRSIGGLLKNQVARVHEEGAANLTKTLEPAVAELGKTGVAIELSVRVGLPAEEIVQSANEKGFDLVVLGARGLGGIRRLVLGSVSENVLRHARCPVLIVRRTRHGRPGS